MLVTEHTAGAPDSGLNFIQHHQPIVFITDLAYPIEVIPVGDVDAAFALDGFNKHRYHVVAVIGDFSDRFDIIVWNTYKTLNQGFESGLNLAAAGGGQRGKGATMETLVHDDDCGIPDPFFIAMETGDLYRRFVGFGTGVGEKYPVHRGHFAQFIAQLFLVGNAIDIGCVEQGSGLVTQGVSNFRVRMSQSADGNAGDGVKIGTALIIPQPGALTP